LRGKYNVSGTQRAPIFVVVNDNLLYDPFLGENTLEKKKKKRGREELNFLAGSKDEEEKERLVTNIITSSCFSLTS